jgi:hypothetical protein
MKALAKLLFVGLLLFGLYTSLIAADPIILGVPTSLKLIEGYESHRAVILAVEEINAKGGVTVGKENDYSRYNRLISEMESQVSLFPKRFLVLKNSFSIRKYMQHLWEISDPKHSSQH